MTISLVVAATTNNAIGRNGQLLWHLPNDLKFFKNTTWAMPVIMGRKTFESVGKPLPGRTNIVITAQPGWTSESIITATGLNDALQQAEKISTNEIFIIGGGQIYEQAFTRANKIYMTRVHTHIDDADTFFPNIDQSQWTQIFKKDMEKDAKHAFDYTFEIWEIRD
ncbi:MAG: dihydrofolate reductase [Bacteroidota bacterium]